MFLGLRTCIYVVEDVEVARDWYAQALGTRPYFDEPFYVGFEVGGFELGIQPGGGSPGKNVEVYWGVDDARAAVDHLVGLGATVHEDVRDVGEGIEVATVTDPFGNLFGVIRNPHFTLR